MSSNIHHIILRSIFTKTLYESVEHKLDSILFPDKLVKIYEAIKYAHKKYNTNLNVEEVTLILNNLNPTLTNTSRQFLTELLSQIDECHSCSQDVLMDTVNEAWKQERIRGVVESLINVADGEDTIDWESIRETLLSIEEGYIDDTPISEITIDDIFDIVGVTDTNNSNVWKFNIPALQDATRGLPKTSFGICAAPPETGKSALWLSLCCGPNGFLHQGAKVHVWRNEENVNLVASRVVSCLLNISTVDIPLHKEEFKQMSDSLTGSLHVLKDDTTAGKDIRDIESYLIRNKGKVDILIVDQIDNITYNGRDAQDDVQTLGKLYATMRRLANQYGIAIMAMTQAGDKAQGKLYYGYDALYASKTNKAATGDYIFTMGKLIPPPGEMDNGVRAINFAKNKMGGPQPPVLCKLNHKVSRIEQIGGALPPENTGEQDE